MSRSRILALAGGFGAILVLAAALWRPAAPGDGSALSLRPRGWYAARRYLEGRGVEARLLDTSLQAAPTAAVLVLAFPFRRELGASDAAALSRHVLQGGLLVLALGDDRLQQLRPAAAWEDEALGAVGLSAIELPEGPSLQPLRWREWAAEEWVLQPAPAAPGQEPGALSELRTAAPRRLVPPPPGAHVLHLGPADQPVVYSFARGRGRVLVLPADVFANRRLWQAGNLDLLESLAATHRGPWTFDEFHHGLVRFDAAQPAGHQRVLDLFLAHVALVYLLGLASVARRFGPAWSDPPVRLGSTASFLLGLAARHHALRHHPAAARAVLRRARELEPRLRVDPLIERRAELGGPADLLAVARAIARSLAPKETRDA